MNQSQVVQELLKQYFGDKKVIGIEIGTKCADLTVAMLMALPNLFLYTIDPWEHRDKAEFEAGEPQEYHDRNKALAIPRLAIPEYTNRVQVLALKSEEAIAFVPKDIDFVWIDGDHSEKGITNDLDLYYPLVKKGCIFGGHDFGQCHPLTEIIIKRYGSAIKTGEDFTWWIIK